MQRQFLWGLVVLLSATSCVSPPPDARSPLEGAWRFSSLETVSANGETTQVPVYENLLLFTARHYSLAFSRGDSQSPAYVDTWNPTQDEAAARVAAIVVNTGTYETSGSNLTTSPFFALVPSYIGGRAEFEFSISGDTLTMRNVRITSADGVILPGIEAGRHDIYKLVRIE
jgi:hypothetical protein